MALHDHCEERGAKVYVAPMDVYFADDTILEPDVLAIRADRVDLLEDQRFVEVAPDLAVEVSSPSTRGYDLVRKRRVYEEHGVPEFWFVDLDARRVEVHTATGRSADAGGGYGAPQIVERGGTVASEALEGLTVDVDWLLGT